MKLNSCAVTSASLFAGVGGFCSGFDGVGITTLWANENNAHAANTFRANHPNVPMIEKDICDLTVAKDKLKPVDILTAGFPCQSFSCAGRKEGFGDERGKLFFQIIRLIEEFGANKPKIILLENVPHLASGEGGHWLQTIITQIQLTGYWFSREQCKTLKTDEVSDLPQGRERLFMIAASTDAFYCNDFIFPQKITDFRSLKEFISRRKKAPSRDYLPTDNRYYSTIAKQMEQGGKDSIYQLRRYYVREYAKKCPTLTANMGGGGHNVPFIRDRWGIRRLSIAECAALQGFDNLSFAPDTPRAECYRQIGNAVPVPLAEKMGVACHNFLHSVSRCEERMIA